MSIIKKSVTGLFDPKLTVDPLATIGRYEGPGRPIVHNKHHRTAPHDAVYIGRGSPWGNPFVIGQHGSRAAVIEKFKWEVLPHLDVTPLRGKHLVCFCKPQECHGDMLLEAANT